MSGCDRALPYRDPLDRYELTLPVGWSLPETVTPTSAVFGHRSQDGEPSLSFVVQVYEQAGEVDLNQLVLSWQAAQESSGLTGVQLFDVRPWYCGAQGELAGILLEQGHFRAGREERMLAGICFVGQLRYELAGTAPQGEWGRYRGYMRSSIRSFRAVTDATAP